MARFVIIGSSVMGLDGVYTSSMVENYIQGKALKISCVKCSVGERHMMLVRLVVFEAVRPLPFCALVFTILLLIVVSLRDGY